MKEKAEKKRKLYEAPDVEKEIEKEAKKEKKKNQNNKDKVDIEELKNKFMNKNIKKVKLF